MDSEQITPSVIAAIMGFDELQRSHQPVPKRQRVLSENYMSKVASIGVCRKKHSSNREQEKMEHVAEDAITLKRDKQQIASPGRKGRTNPGSLFLPIHAAKEHFGNCIQKPVSLISKGIINAQAAPPHRRAMRTKSSSSYGFEKNEIHRKYRKEIDWGTSKLKRKRPNGLISLKQKFGKREKSLRCSSLTLALKGFHSGDRKTRESHMFQNESLFVKSKERKKLDSGMKHCWQKDEVSSEIGVNLTVSTPRKALLCPELQGGATLGTESKKRMKYSSSFFDLRDEDHISSYCSDTYLQCPIDFEEAYHHSPVSVLESVFEEEASDDFQSFPIENLHGLEQRLDILKSKESLESFSEGSEMIRLSDVESDKEGLFRFFGVQETRDFSYMDKVLSYAGFYNNKWVSATWHSSDLLIDPTIFDKLEKNYRDHTSWKRSDRRLLFDCINLGLLEILESSFGVQEWKKPLSRRLSHMVSIAKAKQEVWKLLVSREKKSKQESAHNDDGWLELDEDIELIVREVESMLFDELVAEIVSIE